MVRGSTSRLQWGRRFSTAETWVAGTPQDLSHDPSMGPPFLNGGNTAVNAAITAVSSTFNGAAVSQRRKLHARTIDGGRSTPSMGPPFLSAETSLVTTR